MFRFDQDVLSFYRRCKNAGIPQEILELDWEDFQSRDKDGKPCDSVSLKHAHDFADLISYYWRSGGGLFIIGPNGSGKSFLSYQIAKTAIRYKIPTICFTLIEYLEARRFQKIQPSLIIELMKDIEKANVIIIDDYGKEYGTGKDWNSYEAYTAIFNVFKEGATKCVVLNTALGLEQFGEKAGTSMLSRMARFTTVSLSGTDFRDNVIDPASFRLVRSNEADHSHCYEPHPLLTPETRTKHPKCIVCKYRFHPTLCMRRFNKQWVARKTGSGDGTGTA